MSTLFSSIAPIMRVESPPRLPIPAPDLPFTEKYRPRKLADVHGQIHAITQLRRFAEKPVACAMILHGATGVGKSATGRALADAVGCATEWDEAGGLRQIDAGSQTADSVRELKGNLSLLPFCGSGWRVCIVNEADGMSKQAEKVWLDLLECLPSRCIVVFTTNDITGLSQRFVDRCRLIDFDSKADLNSQNAVMAIAAHICNSEGREMVTPDGMDRVYRAALCNGQVSYRRVVKAIEAEMG